MVSSALQAVGRPDLGVGFAWPDPLTDWRLVVCLSAQSLRPQAHRSLCTGVGLNLLSNIHTIINVISLIFSSQINSAPKPPIAGVLKNLL